MESLARFYVVCMTDKSICYACWINMCCKMCLLQCKNVTFCMLKDGLLHAERSPFKNGLIMIVAVSGWGVSLTC